MAPLTKDSVEVAGSVNEVGAARPAPQTKPAPAGGQLRADARSLEIPVKVHGSRVSDAPHGAAPRTEPFEEQTTTMIIFPQGGVIRMSTSVNVGQMLVVTNLKTRQDAICRVVKVRTFTNMQGYVEVEFTHKQEGYWGVQFSVNGAAPVSQPAAATVSIPATISAPVVAPPVQSPAAIPPAPPAPVHVAQEVVTTPPVASVIAPPFVAPTPVEQGRHVAPLPPPTFVPPPPPPPPVVAPVAQAPFVAPPSAPSIAKPDTPFVLIGTQEEVQPAASVTATIKPGLPSLSSRPAAPVRHAAVTQIPSPELPKAEIPQAALPLQEVSAPEISTLPLFPGAPPAAPVAPLTMSELRGDEPTPILGESLPSVAATTLKELPALEEKPAESSRAVFGSLSGGASFGASRLASSETFGVRLDDALGSSEDSKAPGRSNNWMLIAVCVGVLFAVVAGGALYFRSQANGGSGKSSSGISQPTPQSQQVAAEQDALQNSASRSPVSGPIANALPSSAPAVTVSAGSSSSASKAGTVVKGPVSKTAALIAGATIEHPVTTQRGDVSNQESAPGLDVGTSSQDSNGNALPGIISSSALPAPAAPEIKPEGPIVVGGQVAEPRLVYRALPLYPLNAKQAGIVGDVVIKTTIDQKGNVVDMHVVSGPMMLRQAALDALRRWKYEPSKLDGQPISVQMLVTLKFSR